MESVPPDTGGEVSLGYFKVNSDGDSYYIHYCQYASDYELINGKCAYSFHYDTDSWFAFRNSEEYSKFYTRNQRTRTYLVYTEVKIVYKNHPDKKL